MKFNIVIRAMGAGDRITCFTIYKESIAIFSLASELARASPFSIVTHTTAEKGVGLLIKYCEN